MPSRRLVEAALAQDREAIRTAALDAGFVARGAIDNHSARIDRMIEVILGELHRPGPFDFGDRAFVDTLRDQGMEIAADKAAWHLPPADLLFVQRKVSGTALLGARFKARVDVRALVADALTQRSEAA